MMKQFEQPLKALTSFLNSEKIKYVVLGGLAVSLYGEPRFTADIDVNVILARDGINDFLKKCKSQNFYPLIPNIKQVADKSGVIPLEFVKQKKHTRCDVIIAQNALEYSAVKRGRLRKFGSVSARVVSPEDLVLHKIISLRPRDREDVKGILIRQKGKLDLSYIKDWLKRIDKIDKELKLKNLFEKMIKEI